MKANTIKAYYKSHLAEVKGFRGYYTLQLRNIEIMKLSSNYSTLKMLHMEIIELICRLYILTNKGGNLQSVIHDFSSETVCCVHGFSISVSSNNEDKFVWKFDNWVRLEVLIVKVDIHFCRWKKSPNLDATTHITNFSNISKDQVLCNSMAFCTLHY